MAQSIPLTFRAAPLPEGYKADPEQFKNDIVARLYAESTQSIAFFASGSVAPSSNVGPWLKNGLQWWVWDDGTAAYVPMAFDQSSLKYAVQNSAPDHTVYLFWIELDVGGAPVALKTWYSGAWVDVYAASLGSYMTTAAFTAAIASYSTTAQMNTAISAALASYSTTAAMNTAISTSASSTLSSAQSYTDSAIAAISSYKAQGVNSGSQTIAVDNAAHKINLGSAPINPSPSPFSTANSRYVAPANGYYMVSATSQFDNSTGTASGMEVGLSLYKNGSFAGNALADLDGTPSPNGSRWSPSFSGLIQLAATDYIELYALARDGVNVGNITATAVQMSVFRVA